MILIYVLCYDFKTFKIANQTYSKYKWAKPIILKYQDYSFENAFWKQLKELEQEWINCEMVGTIAYSAHKKIDIKEINEIIENKYFRPNKYFHFFNSNLPIENKDTNTHPHFITIWNDVLKKLNLKTTTENLCNYWMCSPIMMVHFISWYTLKCLPVLLENPFIFEDAKYKENDENLKETKEIMTKLWGKPFYPHFPFIAERLNKCFFETHYSAHVEIPNNFDWKFYSQIHSNLNLENCIKAKQHYYKYGQFQKRLCCGGLPNNMKPELSRYNNLMPKMVFLITHDKSKGGAQNCLFNLKNVHDENGIKTEMLYLENVKDLKNIDFVEYVLNKSSEMNCCPVVICNTLCCHEIVLKLSKTSILTYWYIHEWYDDFTKDIYNKYIFADVNIFGNFENINLIFVCNASLKNYSQLVPVIKNAQIIYNTYSTKCLDKLISEQPTKILLKKDNQIYLSIIGTVDSRKNQQAFINNVFCKLKDKFKNIKLLIVGLEIETLIISPFYKDDIIVLGVVDNALPYINDFADIVVSYSVNEVLPMNIIESFYCSKPVVASNIGGLNEMIIDGDNGFLFEVNDFKKCFQILQSLIENEHLRKTVGDRAKQVFYEKFDEQTVLPKLLSLVNYK